VIVARQVRKDSFGCGDSFQSVRSLEYFIQYKQVLCGGASFLHQRPDYTYFFKVVTLSFQNVIIDTNCRKWFKDRGFKFISKTGIYRLSKDVVNDDCSQKRRFARHVGTSDQNAFPFDA
jgi:hypothetical protein